LSTKVERSQIEWRRSKVAELDSQGHSQPDIEDIAGEYRYCKQRFIYFKATSKTENQKIH
jgi:hypothetical protein